MHFYPSYSVVRELVLRRVTAASPETRGFRNEPGGADRNRTDDIQLAKLALYQLSYTPQVIGRRQWDRFPRRVPVLTDRYAELCASEILTPPAFDDEDFIPLARDQTDRISTRLSLCRSLGLSP